MRGIDGEVTRRIDGEVTRGIDGEVTRRIGGGIRGGEEEDWWRNKGR